MNNNFDLIIVGSGLIGASLALALKDSSYKIAVVDAKAPAFRQESITDLRTIALSHISMEILKGLSLWQALEKDAMPIKDIHISDQGHFGQSRIRAKKLKVPALGYVISLQQLLKNMTEKISIQSNISYLSNHSLEKIKQTADNAELLLKTDAGDVTVKAKLVVAADGGQSKVRQLLNIRTKEHDYGQSAIVANIGLERDHKHIAFERFTQNGPLALLPLAKKSYALVWTCNNGKLNEAINCSDEVFLAKLQQQFGYRLGRFSWVGKRQSFPLKLVFAKEQVKSNIVLIGNAAHTLHPVAGQGFNLGLRDVASLADVLLNAKNLDNLDDAALADYQTQRLKDQKTMINLTDSLIRIFSNDYMPLILLRNLALLGLDLSVAKDFLSYKSMGYINPLPRLAMESLSS